MLAKLVVDYYAPSSLLAKGLLYCLPPRTRRRALAAEARNLPSELVSSLNGYGFRNKITDILARKNGRPFEGFLKSDSAFACKVASLRLPAHNVFFGYSYASLETLRAEKARGILTVLGQIDPGRFEHELVAEEVRRWPDCGIHEAFPPESYFTRNQQEWEIADVVVVNSEWSKRALVKKGVPENKLEILPLAYEPEPNASSTGLRCSGAKPLKVLWLGTVCLRKGIQYLGEAAKLLSKEPVEFWVAGPLAISTIAVKNSPRNIQWLGQVPRSQAAALYQKADIFVLPTLSDGFAITQLEAFAHGLPVITTPNCGRVVEDGVTGFIIPPRDPKSLAEAILRFVRDPNLTAEMSPRCIEAFGAFSIDVYAKRLVEIIEKHMARRR